MKIVMVCFASYPCGMGPARRVYLLGKALSVAGHEVHVVGAVNTESEEEEEDYNGVVMHWAGNKCAAGRSRFRQRITCRVSIMQHLVAFGRQGFDWVYLYNIGLESAVFIALARRYGMSVAVDSCDLWYLDNASRRNAREIVRWLCWSLHDRILAPSYALNTVSSRFLERHYFARAPRVPTLVVPALVDTDTFIKNDQGRTSFREHWGLGKEPVISYLGSFRKIEGISYLFRAFRLLTDNGYQAKLVLSGKHLRHALHDDIVELIAELKLDGRVVFTGNLPIDRVPQAIAAADILVIPKIDHDANRAGFPLKLAEYLSVGKALVVTRVGDIEEYLTDGHDSLLCPPNDEVALAHAIKRLLDNPELASRLATNARQTAITQFGLELAGQRLAQAMESASERQ